MYKFWTGLTVVPRLRESEPASLIHWIKALALTCFCVVSAPVFAQHKIISAAYAIDRDSRQAGLEGVDRLQWVDQSLSKAFSFGYTDATIWIKLTVSQDAPNNSDFYVAFDNSFLNDVRLYSSNGTYVPSGFETPIETRPFQYKSPIFPIKIMPGTERTLLFSVRTAHACTFKIRILSHQEIDAEMSSERFLIGFYLGFMFLLFAFNLLLYFITKKPASLIYGTIVLLTYGTVFPDQYGYLASFLPWIAFTELRLASSPLLINIPNLVFVRYYLQLPTRWPGMCKAFDALSLLTLLYALPIYFLGQVRNPHYIELGDYLIAAMMVVGITTGIYFSIKRLQEAIAYILCFIPPIICGAIFLAYINGIDFGMDSIKYSLFYGSALHVSAMTGYMALSASREYLQTQNEIIELNHDLENRVEEKTRDIRSIMTNIQFGIFTFVREGYAIQKDYSHYLEALLEQGQLEGANALNIIFQNSNLGTDEMSQTLSAIEFAFDAAIHFFYMNDHCLPSEISRRRVDGSIRIIELIWNPIADEHGVVRKILVTLRDVTELRQLQNETQEKKLELEYVAELISVTPEAFRRFLNSCSKLSERNRMLMNSIRADGPNTEILHEIFINIHTIKGAARSLYFKKMTKLIHDVEQQMVQMQNSEIPILEPDSVRAILDRVDDAIRIYEAIHSRRFGFHAQADEHIPAVSVFDLLQDVLDTANRLAHEMKKPEPRLIIEGDHFTFNRSTCEGLRNIFIHLVSNSMDHGIESAEERLRKGKTAQGQLLFKVAKGESAVAIHFEDDGQGLNLDLIKHIALQRNLIEEGASLTDQELVNLIFHPGFSTAERVSEISGRGIGMAAIKTFITDMDGRVEMVVNGPALGSSRPFHLRIELPLSCAVAKPPKALLQIA